MTVSSTYTAPQYSGNGVSAAFSFPYAFFSPSDLVVVLFDATTALNTPVQPVLNGGATYDYTVSGSVDANLGEYASATITFNTPPASNHRITIYRAVPATQQISLSNTGAFPAKTIEGELDRLTMVAQQLAAAQARSLLAPVTDLPLNLGLPAVDARKNMMLGFNGSGVPVALASLVGTASVSSTMIPVVQASTRAEAFGLIGVNGGTIGAITINGGTVTTVINGTGGIVLNGPFGMTGTMSLAGSLNIAGHLGVAGAGDFSGKITAANGVSGGEVVNAGQFPFTPGVPGKATFPNGLKLQWGIATSGALGVVTVVWPEAFPSGLYHLSMCPTNIASGVYGVSDTRRDTGSADFVATAAGAPTAGIGFYWLALGA